jgi:hypothetical protein
MAVAVMAVAGMGGGAAFAADPQHGISLTKGCVSPTQIGAPYVCTYSVRNTIDEAQDTLTINSLVDVVHAQGGDVSSGNVLSKVQLVIGPFLAGFSTPPTCTGPTLTGNGTEATPWTGATSCTLPFGSRINVSPFSFYTVKATDFNLAGHILSDSVSLGWHDVCNGTSAPGSPAPGGGNCNPDPPDVGAASQSIITQLPSTTATTIHSAAHGAVLTVPAGTTVHDLAVVDGGQGNPVPTGTVTLDWFTNDTCTGAPATTSAPLALLNGQVDATAFPQGPLAAGAYGFKAHYQGDPANPVYTPSDGPCEPLAVADDGVRTDVHNATHGVVTSVTSGTSVHDKVFVTKLAGTPASVPAPAGNVTFHRYATIDCTGATVDETVALGADGTAETSAFTATANMSYKADYAGNANYPARSGACEPLQVTSGGGGGSPGTPAIGITKNPKEQTVQSGGTATWTIVVTNTGQVTLTNVRVTDPEAPDCNRTSAQIPALASMAPGASQTYTCSRPNVTASFTNVATDTGTPPSGPDVSASDSAHVTVPTPLTPPTPTPKPTPKPTVKPAVLNPDIQITKNPKSQTVAKGAPAGWTIVVTNTGENKLHNVRVTDPKAPKCNRNLGFLNVGQSKTYTCARPNTQEPYTNVANVVGTSPQGKKVTDNDSAKVLVAPLKPAIVKPKPKPKPKPPVVSHEKPKNTG